jgi:hypothetical protein
MAGATSSGGVAEFGIQGKQPLPGFLREALLNNRDIHSRFEYPASSRVQSKVSVHLRHVIRPVVPISDTIAVGSQDPHLSGI